MSFKLEEIAEVLIEVASEATISGSWCFGEWELKEMFSTPLSKDMEEIANLMLEDSERVAWAEVYTDESGDKVIDMGLYLDYCPNAETEEDEEF